MPRHEIGSSMLQLNSDGETLEFNVVTLLFDVATMFSQCYDIDLFVLLTLIDLATSNPDVATLI